MKRNLPSNLLLYFFLFCGTLKTNSQTITLSGAKEVAPGATEVYTATFSYTLNPQEILHWEVTGGTIISESTNPMSAYIYCSIQWDTNIGIGHVSLIDSTTFSYAEIFVLIGRPKSCPQANAGPDKTICPGGSAQIGTPAIPGYQYSWAPGTGLNNQNIAEPISTPPTSLTYTLIVTGEDNLLSNPDFEAGLTGFTTDYGTFPNGIGCSSGWVHGSIEVVTDPTILGGVYCSHPDHSTNGNKMLFADGTCTPNMRVWSQTVTVIPNSVYYFSGFASSASTRFGYYAPVDAARLRVRINGVNILQNWINAFDCNSWAEFAASWNSGNASSATIEIFDDNLNADLNDFCLDDLYFGGCPRTSDQVNVLVRTNIIPVISPAAPIYVCTPWEWAPTNTVLLTSSSTISGQYQWYKDGLIIPGATSQTYNAQHSQQGTIWRAHYFSVKDPVASCTSSAVRVDFLPTPLTPEGFSIQKGVWTTINTVDGLPGTTYTWNIPGASVNELNIYDPYIDVLFPTGSPSQVYGSVTIGGSAQCAAGTWSCVFYVLGLKNELSQQELTQEEETDFNRKVFVFPNPANNLVTIVSEYGIRQIEIYSISGALVRQVQSRGEKTKTIDISMLNNGLYYCKIISKNDVKTKKLLIQKP